jgi:uncharacterized repeat protein (TIGR01451 family)
MVMIEHKKTMDDVHPSDIAGTDLYSESIDAYIAGNKSIIKQSLFTNDTSILPQFDTRDPAFYKCNVLLSTSNGITPEIFPRLVTEQDFLNQYQMTFNGFSGFLFYDEEVKQEEANVRAERALKIINEKFQVDLIPVNTSEPNFFPFIGHYPDWNIYLDEVIRNVPKDGYWKALDINRLTSNDYINNYHLSSTYFLINSLDILEQEFLNSNSQVNYNIESLNLNFLQNLEIENIFSQFFGLNTSIGGINETLSGFESFNEIFKAFSLSNQSHYTTMMIQYEGAKEAIKKTGENEYSFNLWEAMGYESGALRPSEKVFIALIGAFMSEINLRILCSDIIYNTPEYFNLYDFLLEQVSQLLYYANIDINIETVKNYLFELVWVDNGGFKESYIRPKNLNNSADYLNLLPILGFQGIPGILTGLFNPIQDLTIKYHISNSEPNLLIKKNLVRGNASFGVFNNYDFNITVKNVGNETVWGVPTFIPLDLDTVFSVIAGPLSEELMDSIWEVVRIEYPNQYESLEDFFNFNKDPKVLYFDSLGTGLVDKYFPNLNNLTNLLPYNQDMDNVIDSVIIENPQLISGLLLLGITPDDLKEIFTNKNSIWNEDNWYIEPNQSISYIYSNFSISNLDSFTPFYINNFTIKSTYPPLPAIISGASIGNTTPSMALLDDNQAWNISSEEKYIDYNELEVQFLFQNDSAIDLMNNSIDRISLLINYSDPSDVINLEIFNFSSGEFIDIAPFFDSIENGIARYSFIKYEDSLEWIFDPESRSNHSIIFRIIGSDADSFNISINNLDIEFSYRDNNRYNSQGARIFYSTESGNVLYIRRSNSISMGTYEMASIVAIANVSHFSSKSGQENKYKLDFQNIGSEIATNINVTLMCPGIILDSGNFTQKDGILTFLLDELSPLEKKTIEFRFYTPNNVLIKSLEINYNSTTKIENLNSSKIENHANEVYCSAKVDYQRSFPFVKSVQIEFNTSSVHPSIGQEFNLSVRIFNDGFSKLNITNLKLSLNDRYGDLIRLNEPQLSFPNIVYNVGIKKDITVLKVDWKAYYYGPINYFDDIDKRLIQISKSNPIILGHINLTIQKEIEKTQIQIGEIVEITIRVKNDGNICIKNLTLSDDVSFTQIEFSLVEGKLINEIECLSPGEIIAFSYKVRAKTQNLIILKPAAIDYYFLKKNIASSNTIEVKIVIPLETQSLFIIIPTFIALAVLIGYLFEMNRYKSKRFELQRNEEILFNTEGIDSVIKVDKTLRDHLNKVKSDQNSNGDEFHE